MNRPDTSRPDNVPTSQTVLHMPKRKRSPVAYAVSFGGSWLGLWLWNYLSGRFNFHYNVLLFLCVTFALFGIAVVTLGATLVSASVSAGGGQFRTPLLSILLLGACGGLPFLVRVDLYLLGVRQRISAQMTPDQIRQIADRATLLLSSERAQPPISGPSISSKMMDLPGFANFEPDSPVFFTGPYGVVAIFGGCGVCGHTGLQVQQPIITAHYSRGPYLSIAPDIEVFYKP